jgi:hypothetical protein
MPTFTILTHNPLLVLLQNKLNPANRIVLRVGGLSSLYPLAGGCGVCIPKIGAAGRVEDIRKRARLGHKNGSVSMQSGCGIPRQLRRNHRPVAPRARLNKKETQLCRASGISVSNKNYAAQELVVALVCKVGAEFLDNYDATTDRCWIAERNDEFLGCIVPLPFLCPSLALFRIVLRVGGLSSLYPLAGGCGVCIPKIGAIYAHFHNINPQSSPCLIAKQTQPCKTSTMNPQPIRTCHWKGVD